MGIILCQDCNKVPAACRCKKKRPQNGFNSYRSESVLLNQARVSERAELRRQGRVMIWQLQDRDKASADRERKLRQPDFWIS